jgi:hypothetical protein
MLDGCDVGTGRELPHPGHIRAGRNRYAEQLLLEIYPAAAKERHSGIAAVRVDRGRRREIGIKALAPDEFPVPV